MNDKWPRRLRKGQLILCVEGGSGVVKGKIYMSDKTQLAQRNTDLVHIRDLGGDNWNQCYVYRFVLANNELPKELKETKTYEI